ncbi:hypothetical protein [Deinococcus soli (ex Cha et al. 2016)]|uniref:Uncharacterized protein n=2 Tax=Deinococcus soli (ex Cha et al. 2016) TaxID=1309411 RepID=A0ACC6KH24_9DEIO|nr:hypothetical protein [Deinococcus soli (ex Cha et al. 2016)]MDR6218962.1 hypothetical protein [Deinococcus soli (ex Cha et al. 2016)]MDR6328759.1 hypothetical protein [Deinococcus soli (ex Cha et al. 2016)]MDR6751754.1 hypothetical protein [Deinococcus soli (ex Cha et al. 2016)]
MSPDDDQCPHVHRHPVWHQHSLYTLTWRTDTTLPTPDRPPLVPQERDASCHLARLGHGVLVTPSNVLESHGVTLSDPPGTGPRSRVIASGMVSVHDRALVTSVRPETLTWDLDRGQPRWTATAVLPRHEWRRVARREHLLLIHMIGRRWSGARTAVLVADRVTFAAHEKRQYGTQWVHLRAEGTL